MENFKKLLANRLSDSVTLSFDHSKLIYFEESDEGFFCDYAIPPINPAIFSEIGKNIDILGIDCAFELHSFSGVYENGNAENRMLQRVYAIAFQTRTEFETYKGFLSEALKHDHKTLGNELKLFSVSNDIGQGLTLSLQKKEHNKTANER